jgi:hypothetical protein
VSRLIAAGKLSRYTITLAHGNSLFTTEKLKDDHRPIKLLYANGFYGRPTLRNLVDCLRSSHPNVSPSDVAAIAAIAALEIGPPGDFVDWRETNAVIAAFEELEILQETAPPPYPTWLFNKSLFLTAGIGVGVISTHPAHIAFRRKLKYTLAESLADWFRLNGFVSDNGTTVAQSDCPANYLSLPFDIVGFCFLSGLANRTPSAPRPRAVVADCLVEECNLPYAKSFAERIDQCSIKSKSSIFGAMLCRTFESGAFRYLRERGVATWTQSQLPGAKTADAIQRVLSIAESLILQHQLDPHAFAEVFDGLNNYSSLFGNLKGKPFELLIAYLFQRRCSITRLGWEIERDDQAYDVDVFAVQGSCGWVVECKGIKQSNFVPHSEVEKHFRRRVPMARQIALDSKIHKIQKVSAIIVTTGQFEEHSTADVDAKAYGHREDTKHELWGRERLIKELQNEGLPAMCRLHLLRARG